MLIIINQLLGSELGNNVVYLVIAFAIYQLLACNFCLLSKIGAGFELMTYCSIISYSSLRSYFDLSKIKSQWN